MKVFNPPLSMEHIVHIYPANLLEFINGVCERYYIIDDTVIMHLDMTNNTYTKIDDIVADDWHNVCIECYDATTGDIKFFQSPTRLYNIEKKYAYLNGVNSSNKQYYFNYDTSELLDFDGTSFTDFTTLNDFVIYDRFIYYKNDQNILMKRDIIDKTETQALDLTGDFWFMYDFSYKKSFWIVFPTMLYRVHDDEIVTILTKEDNSQPVVDKVLFMYHDIIYIVDNTAASPTAFMGY